MTQTLVREWLSLPDVAVRLGVDVGRVRTLLRDRQLVAVRGEDNSPRVPAALVEDGRVVKGLAGTLTLLADAGYDDEESVRWLFTPDETLPGSPAEALRENRGTEVKRRAQALGF
jgi:hypothetical protein